MDGYGLSNVGSSNTPFPCAENVSNVELTSCTYVDGNTWEAIDFVYSRKTDDGTSILKDRVFKVNPEMAKAASYIPNDTNALALDRAMKTFNSKLMHIASKFKLDKDILDQIKGPDFKSFATKYCTTVNPVCKNVMLYCKTVKDNKGYVKIPKNPTFLQRMDAGPCELKWSVREIAANAVATPTNGAAINVPREQAKWE